MPNEKPIIYTPEQIKAAAEACCNSNKCLCPNGNICPFDNADEYASDCAEHFATRLLTLESEAADLRARLAESEKRATAADETIQRMAHDMVCFGCIDSWLCDDIPQEIHLKYQPKNDGNYPNEPCYKCIEEYYRGLTAQEGNKDV